MNLLEHKLFLRQYESVIFELEELSRAKEERMLGWELRCQGVLAALLVSDEMVSKLLQERIWALESDAKDRALALGIGA